MTSSEWTSIISNPNRDRDFTANSLQSAHINHKTATIPCIVTSRTCAKSKPDQSLNIGKQVGTNAHTYRPCMYTWPVQSEMRLHTLSSQRDTSECTSNKFSNYIWKLQRNKKLVPMTFHFY